METYKVGMLGGSFNGNKKIIKKTKEVSHL